MEQSTRDTLVYEASKKSPTVAYLLWFFLGGFAAHRFYCGKTGSAVVMLLLSLISWATTWILIGFVGVAIWTIWWIIDVFLINTWIKTHNMQIIQRMDR